MTLAATLLALLSRLLAGNTPTFMSRWRRQRSVAGVSNTSAKSRSRPADGGNDLVFYPGADNRSTPRRRLEG